MGEALQGLGTANTAFRPRVWAWWGEEGREGVARTLTRGVSRLLYECLWLMYQMTTHVGG